MAEEDRLILIKEKRYYKLAERSAFLEALENAGVDNWEGYDEAVLNHRGR